MTTKKKPPTKKPKYKVSQMREAIEKSLGNITVAARRIGCTRQTVYQYIERHPTLKDVLEEARDMSLDFTENQLMKGIKRGNPTLIIFHLKTQGKKRGYIEKQEVEHTVKDWRSEAIALIKRGEVTFLKAKKDLGEDLAHELFKSAGVAIVRK